MAYSLEGTILEVCDCNVLCPCWIGEDPDNGTCQSALAYNITKGDIDGVDVSGLNVAVAVFIPGNVLNGGWRAIRFIDERASPGQEAALLAVFRGQKGGPLEDLAGLVGEEVAARRAPIRYEVSEGKGRLTIGDGIVTQIPALIISIGTGIIITRSASDARLSAEISRQFTNYPKTLFLVLAALGVMMFLPGIPAWPMFVIGPIVALLAVIAMRRKVAEVKEVLQEKPKGEV